MKILIAADMEGITGVTNWDQVTPGHAEYSRFRRLMTADVNAAVLGCLAGGADEVAIADGHWNGSNILIEELDPRAALNTGSPSPFSMMQGVDMDVQGVLFIGYHARQGSAEAILDHTWSSRCVANLWLNETLTGEYGLNAALAGHFGVPVLMISGDQTACAQASEQLGELETAVVKRAGGRTSAECLSLEAAHTLIQAAAQRAIQRLARGQAPAPHILKEPVSVTVEFFTSDMADRAMHLPGAERSGLRLTLTVPDMPRAYSAFRSLVMLANA
jgi:D-amino peptidase